MVKAIGVPGRLGSGRLFPRIREISRRECDVSICLFEIFQDRNLRRGKRATRLRRRMHRTRAVLKSLTSIDPPFIAVIVQRSSDKQFPRYCYSYIEKICAIFDVDVDR